MTCMAVRIYCVGLLCKHDVLLSCPKNAWCTMNLFNNKSIVTTANELHPEDYCCYCIEMIKTCVATNNNTIIQVGQHQSGNTENMVHSGPIVILRFAFSLSYS